MNDTLSLQALFNNRIFKVPDYQRGYAWEEQQVGEFLDDLALLDSSRRHYTGTVVLYQPAGAKEIDDNEGAHYVEVDVVDGQQRLTTTVLLINEISRALSGYPDSSTLALGVRRRYVEVKDINGLPLHKLSLNRDTDGFFKTNVLPGEPQDLAGPAVVSAQRLLDARKQIADYLDEAEGDRANREQWLRELLTKITMRLHFNLYEVDRESEVGVIFEVMNDRGKPLTDLEKVKNYLLYAASALHVTDHNREHLARAVNEAWAYILTQLMGADLGSPASENQMLRAHWLMEYDPQSQNWDGSKSIRNRFDLRKENHDQLLGELHDYVRGLRNSCVSFCDALRPNRGGAFSAFSEPVRSQVVIWNRKLTRIGVTATFLPLLMAVRKRWHSEPGKYLEFLKICEVFAFRTYRIGKYYANYRQPAMFRLAHNAALGRLDFDAVVREIKHNYGSRESRLAFDAFTDLKTPRGWYRRAGINYFLYEYEAHLAAAQGGSPKVEWSEVESRDTIEHILPQYIGDQPYWQKRFNGDTHEEYKHDIGNLTLTKGNSSLGNKSFTEKKGTKDTKAYCYANSLLLVEREIADKWNDWSVEAINKRRAMLLGWAKQRWYVDFSDIDGETYDDDEESEDELALISSSG